MISLAAGARGWGWLLFSPFGAIGRRLYMSGAVAVVVLNLALVWIVGHRIHSPYVLVGVCTLTLPMAVCLTAKRLHAISRSGWWQAPVRIMFAVGIISTAVSQHNREWIWLIHLSWISILLGAVGDLILFAWMAIAPSHPAAEKVVDLFD